MAQVIINYRHNLFNFYFQELQTSKNITITYLNKLLLCHNSSINIIFYIYFVT